ncbi:MAG: TetR family transcriptional regulator [Myxococcota bacterium]
MARRADGERKRALIFETALALFRDKGFDETTMRDIAAKAEISVGSAYHYFPSKQAIVFAYYDEQQAEHERLARGRLAKTSDLRERLGIVFHSKIEAVRKDRSLLIAIARRIPDASDPLSVFSEESRRVRERATELFAEALDGVDDEHREILGKVLWALHIASLAYLVNDSSRGQRKTRELIDGTLDLVTPLVMLAGTPAFAPLLGQIDALARRAGLT